LEQDSHPRLNIDPVQVIKIKVLNDGTLMLNDKSASVDQIGEFLNKQKDVPGTHVLYYRENAVGAPHPNAMLVIRAVADARLPIRLSAKPDFSDAVGLDRKSL